MKSFTELYQQAQHINKGSNALRNLIKKWKIKINERINKLVFNSQTNQPSSCSHTLPIPSFSPFFPIKTHINLTSNQHPFPSPHNHTTHTMTRPCFPCPWLVEVVHCPVSGCLCRWQLSSCLLFLFPFCVLCLCVCDDKGYEYQWIITRLDSQ